MKPSAVRSLPKTGFWEPQRKVKEVRKMSPRLYSAEEHSEE